MAAGAGGAAPKISSEPTPKASNVVVLFRHGARGLSKNERDELGRFGMGDAIKCWEEHDLEKLTSVGMDQMRSLGRWMRRGFLSKRLEGDLEGDVEWFTSPADRAVESGCGFWQGFEAEPKKGDTSKFGGAKKIFLPWVDNEAYDEDLRKWHDSVELDVESESHAPFLNRVLPPTLGLEPFAAPPKSMLCSVVSLHHLLSCELHWPTTARSLQSELPEPPLAALPPSRNFASSSLASDDKSHVSTLARWVLDQQCFVVPESKTLGKPILNLIVNQLTTSKFSAMSAHDYTILALLASLRIPQYPEHILGFGSFVILERIPNPSDPDQSTIALRICHDPFPHASQGKPASFSPKNLTTIFEDVPFEAIQHMATTTPKK